MAKQEMMYSDGLRFVVRSGHGTIYYEGSSAKFNDEVMWATRVPTYHSGWWSVRFQNRWYQVFGGVRTPYFICLNSPIRSAIRQESKCANCGRSTPRTICDECRCDTCGRFKVLCECVK